MLAYCNTGSIYSLYLIVFKRGRAILLVNFILGLSMRYSKEGPGDGHNIVSEFMAHFDSTQSLVFGHLWTTVDLIISRVLRFHLVFRLNRKHSSPPCLDRTTGSVPSGMTCTWL